jgi:hypothetical protein
VEVGVAVGLGGGLVGGSIFDSAREILWLCVCYVCYHVRYSLLIVSDLPSDCHQPIAGAQTIILGLGVFNHTHGQSARLCRLSIGFCYSDKFVYYRHPGPTLLISGTAT